MSIQIHKHSMRPRLNRLWAGIVNTWIAPYVQHEAQSQAAISVMKAVKTMFKTPEEQALYGPLFAQGLFGRELRGAGYAWESRQALIPNPSGTSPVDLSGANGLNFQCHDFCTVMEIGVIFEVAGTTTLLVMDFDKYTAPNTAGTLTDKLDGTNGVITAPSQASQAIGAVLYKNLSNALEIDLNKGNSVRANVTTTVTAGTGIPYVLVIPRSETNANLATGFASS